MELKDIVIDFELAKELKELGVKQNSLYYYKEFNNGDLIHEIKDWIPEHHEQYKISAFTSDELYEMIPYLINSDGKKYYLIIEKGYETQVFYKTLNDRDLEIPNFDFILDKRLCNALAKMLLYLLKTKYMEK
jgi:hypothetical protein